MVHKSECEIGANGFNSLRHIYHIIRDCRQYLLRQTVEFAPGAHLLQVCKENDGIGAEIQ